MQRVVFLRIDALTAMMAVMFWLAWQIVGKRTFNFAVESIFDSRWNHKQQHAFLVRRNSNYWINYPPSKFGHWVDILLWNCLLELSSNSVLMSIASISFCSAGRHPQRGWNRQRKKIQTNARQRSTTQEGTTSTQAIQVELHLFFHGQATWNQATARAQSNYDRHIQEIGNHVVRILYWLLLASIA
jgi:hypothetical protein